MKNIAVLGVGKVGTLVGVLLAEKFKLRGLISVIPLRYKITIYC